MKKYLLLLMGMALFLGGCQDDGSTTALLESKLIQRPIVAITTVIDHSHNHLNWSLSEELSQTVRHFFSKTNRLFLAREDKFPNAGKYLAWCDPFELDLNWIKKAFPDQEFVVFTEIMHHSEIPLSQDGPSQLLVSARLKVIDLRQKTPHVVLQEILEQTHHIPLQFTAHFKEPSHQVAWKDPTYDVSPLGIAHETLAREIASRAEDYILSQG
jgi:hypothetical protein